MADPAAADRAGRLPPPAAAERRSAPPDPRIVELPLLPRGLAGPALALVTAWAVDLAVVDPVGVVHLGRFTVPVATFPSIWLAVALARGRGGWRCSHPGWRPFLTVTLPVLGALAAAAALRSGGDLAGLAVHAVVEEATYRVVVPALLAAACVAAGVRQGAAAAAGVVAGAWLFAVAPGHVAQMRSHGDVVPFVAMGLVLGFAAWRTRSVLPVAVVHLAVNLSTELAPDGGAGRAGRGLLVALLLAGLVVWADRVASGPEGAPAVLGSPLPVSRSGRGGGGDRSVALGRGVGTGPPGSPTVGVGTGPAPSPTTGVGPSGPGVTTSPGRPAAPR